MTLAWEQGTIFDPALPAFAALDHGFTLGDGVFETITVRSGQPFAVTRHLARLHYSLSRMGMPAVDEQHIRNGLAALMAADANIGRIRIQVTSGLGTMGPARGSQPRVVILAGEALPSADIHAVRVPWKRNERSAVTGVKTSSYAENVVMMQYARDHGANEALVSNTVGHLCEAVFANVFIERGGEIVTPPLASGCLAGVTRGLALQWGRRAGLPIRVAEVGELEYAVLDEVEKGRAFAALTASSRGVQPIASMDGVSLQAGPLLENLQQAFWEAAQVEIDPPLPRKVVKTS